MKQRKKKGHGFNVKSSLDNVKKIINWDMCTLTYHHKFKVKPILTPLKKKFVAVHVKFMHSVSTFELKCGEFKLKLND